MNCRDFVDPLTRIGSHIQTLGTVIRFEILVSGSLPFVSPDFGVLSVVPIDGILLVRFPAAGRKFYPLTVLIKIIDLAAFRQPLAVLTYCSHGQHDMRVRIAVSLVVYGKVGAHSF